MHAVSEDSGGDLRDWSETIVDTPHGPIREFGPRASLSDHATRFMIEHIRVPDGAKAAEAGCGTGVLSIYMAMAGVRHAVGTDIDEGSLAAARHNAMVNDVTGVEFTQGSLLEPVQGPLDLVVALLPHKPAPRPFNRRYYGGPDGTDLLLALIEQAAHKVLSGGRLYLYLNSIANPFRVVAALDARFLVHLTGEKKRYFTRKEFDDLTPGMFDYLGDLRKKGMAEFDEDGSGPYFMARIYEAVRR